MTDENRYVREQLARIEGKLDALTATNASTRESVARVQVTLGNVERTQASHGERIGVLEGFRFKLLGAIAAAGAFGGGLGALVHILLGG